MCKHMLITYVWPIIVRCRTFSAPPFFLILFHFQLTFDSKYGAKISGTKFLSQGEFSSILSDKCRRDTLRCNSTIAGCDDFKIKISSDWEFFTTFYILSSPMVGRICDAGNDTILRQKRYFLINISSLTWN